MTGVVKSNRCGTCRKRKVKCDEAKPVCGPCRKSNRSCEPPISKLTFTRPKELQGSFTITTTSTDRPGLLQPCKDISIMESSTTKEGSSFQKMRVARLGRKPARRLDAEHVAEDYYCSADLCADAPNEQSLAASSEQRLTFSRLPGLSPDQALQFSLLDTFNCSELGLRPHEQLACMKTVPSRLGHSKALDTAVGFFVYALSALGRRQPVNFQVHSGLYGKALHNLRLAVQDPVEALSANTLCAVAIIGQVELFHDSPTGAQGYVTHAGGAARMIRTRGPSQHRSDFDKRLLFDMRGPAIVDSIFRCEDCWLDDPEWACICFDDIAASPAQESFVNIASQLVAIPAILRQLRQSNMSHDPSIDYHALLRKAQRLRRDLQASADFVTSAFDKGTGIEEVPSISQDALFPISYRFSSRKIASACVQYWGFSILLNGIIARLLMLAGFASTSTVTIQGLREQCRQASAHIYKSFEYAKPFRPLNSTWMHFPLIISFKYANPSEREWIIGALQILAEGMPAAQRGWNMNGLDIMTKFLFAEALTKPIHRKLENEP